MGHWEKASFSFPNTVLRAHAPGQHHSDLQESCPAPRMNPGQGECGHQACSKELYLHGATMLSSEHDASYLPGDDQLMPSPTSPADVGGRRLWHCGYKVY